jgi:hypothetical protein
VFCLATRIISQGMHCAQKHNNCHNSTKPPLKKLLPTRIQLTSLRATFMFINLKILRAAPQSWRKRVRQFTVWAQISHQARRKTSPPYQAPGQIHMASCLAKRGCEHKPPKPPSLDFRAKVCHRSDFTPFSCISIKCTYLTTREMMSFQCIYFTL